MVTLAIRVISSIVYTLNRYLITIQDKDGQVGIALEYSLRKISLVK